MISREQIEAIVAGAALENVIYFAADFVEEAAVDAGPDTAEQWRALAAEMIVEHCDDAARDGDEISEGGVRGFVSGAVEPWASLLALSLARYTTDDAPEGVTFSLAEMLDANAEHPEVCDAIRALGVGESWADIVTVTRVS